MVWFILTDGRRLSWDDLIDEAERTGRTYRVKMYREAIRDIDEAPWEIEYDKFEGVFYYSHEYGIEEVR